MSDNLRIFLFGGLTIELEGNPIHLTTRKNEALFAYLACHPNQTIQRETLATLLWSEKNQKEAMGNLRTALSGLRDLAAFLEIDRSTLAVKDSQAIWVDSLIFERMEQIALRVSPSGLLTDGELKALTEAVGLYRGEFLEGFNLRDADGFEEWARNLRERFHVAATQALKRLVMHYLANEDYQAGIAWSQRLIEIDPFDDASRRDKMHLLAGNGQTAAALQEYELFSRRLREEGSQPEAETTRLYEQLLKSERRAESSVTITPQVKAPPNNLAQQLTPIIGRDQEIERVTNRLTDSRCRLITVVGPGGVGKTRLAIETGLRLLSDPELYTQFKDGIFFVNLQSIDQPALLPNAIAEVVGCQMQGVVNPENQLLAYLRSRQMLLILDNFEHLLEASELVLQILQQAATVKVLTTSLEPLSFQGEWLFQIQGLPVPSDHEIDWDEFPAIQLFVHSVEQFDADFDPEREQQSIIEICQQLQGLPLGILLAASAVRAYSCSHVAQELRRNLDFLATTMRNVPARHRSLRAVFDYVWDLLAAQDRTLLPRLAVFEGGFSPEAAEAVTSIRLFNLVHYAERSLLQRVMLTKSKVGAAEGEVNYVIHRALHGYLLEKLASDKAQYQEVRQRHCDYFIEILKTLRDKISGTGMGEALAIVHSRIANIRSAWYFAIAHNLIDKLEVGYEALAQYYFRIGPFVEGETLLQTTAAAIRGQIATHSSDIAHEERLLVELQFKIAQFHIELAQYPKALADVEEAAELAARLDCSEALAQVFLLRGQTHYHMGEHEQARQELEQALSLVTQHHLNGIEPRIELYLGNVYGAQANYEASRPHLLRGLEICKNNADPMTELLFYRSLGRIAFFQGDYSEATTLYQRVLDGHNSFGARAGIGLLQNNLGAVLQQVGDYEHAREHYENALELLRDIGDLRIQGLATANLCLLSHQMNDNDAALRYGEESLKLAQERNDRDSEAYVYNCLGHVWYALQDLTRAEEFYRHSYDLRIALGQPGPKLESLAGLAKIALDKGELPAALNCAEQIYQTVQQGRPGGIVEIIRMLLICFDVFSAHRDPRANEIVQLGTQFLVESADKISRPAHRRSFLMRVASHRRMVELAEKAGKPIPEWMLKS
ncbi:MAG: tetratricopeptide repeat protein [Caldilineaceae bacterium]